MWHEDARSFILIRKKSGSIEPLFLLFFLIAMGKVVFGYRVIYFSYQF